MNLSIGVRKKFKKGGKDLLDYTGHRLAKTLEAYIRTSRTPLIFTDHLINWGRSNLEGVEKYSSVLNHPSAVSASSNKLLSLGIMEDHDINCLSFRPFQERWSVEEHMHNNPDAWIVCRTLINSSGGKGIVIAKTKEELVDAPLYTAYFKKKKEYRYHIFQGKLIDVQQKKRLTSEELDARGIDRAPSYIRNLANGYIFAREGVVEDTTITDECIKAIEALDLDFGAVDVLVNENEEGETTSYKICEVNSAPGLSGTTFDKYIEAFKQYYEGKL